MSARHIHQLRNEGHQEREAYKVTEFTFTKNSHTMAIRLDFMDFILAACFVIPKDLTTATVAAPLCLHLGTAQL